MSKPDSITDKEDKIDQLEKAILKGLFQLHKLREEKAIIIEGNDFNKGVRIILSSVVTEKERSEND